MRLDLKRGSILIVPENDQDRAYVEDTFALHKNGDTITAIRVNDVKMGFVETDSFVVKIERAGKTEEKKT